jgi:hypothetical protein
LLILEETEGKLKIQLAQFNGKRDIFANLSVDIAQMSTSSPINVWDLYSCELSVIAKALISVAASEAAVERSFSSQGATHTKRRNRLNNSAVQAEMMIKFNTLALQSKPSPTASYTIMDVDYEPNKLLEESDEEEEDEEESEDEEEILAPAAVNEEIIAPAASPPIPIIYITRKEQVEEGQKRTREFVEQYLAQKNIGADHVWSKEDSNAIESYALATQLKGLGTTKEMTKIARELIAEKHRNAQCMEE